MTDVHQIREWRDIIVSGGALDTTPPWTYEHSLKLAVVRYVNKLGPVSEKEGETAYRDVVEALTPPQGG